ncbi:hypothetical protein roselon_02461 [Roseibacterium elongatum DSM 19469]|uniref:Uncharacterized protein n=1 Tax=Roseicyclus elongatus DSM 19469 TaxID=1294273 RepID=W8RU83_9RHOB|nr:tetratricopeptide repeat protein [Roseibacterium elongatum]AHM04784.1 hypothetical protein roselon_02461 [Roseibacterium elongatum DSM 19469]
MFDFTTATARRGAVAALLCASVLSAGAMPGAAQTASLAQQRDAVFAEMLADPTNRDVMMRYAQLSVQMREFEAAVATLERLIDLEPRNSTARVELGIAYFSLGNYDLAEYHFAAAEAGGALTQSQSAQVARYRQEATRRDADSAWSAHVALGYAFTETDLSQSEGLFGSASLDWRLDLGGPFVTQWVTEAALSSYLPGTDFDDILFNSRQEMRLTTGPEFRLTGDTYGPRLRPYVELSMVRFPDDPFDLNTDFDRAAIGIAYQNPHNERWTTFADLSYGTGELLENGGEDFTYHEVMLGAVFRPSRDTRLRLTVSAEGAEFDFTTDTAYGLRLEAQHAFDAPFDLPRQWVAGAFASADWITTDYDFAFFDDDEETRTAFGVMLRSFVTDSLYLETRVSHVMTELNTGPDQDASVVSAQIGWEF